MLNRPPNTIFLQYFGDQKPSNDPVSHQDITWSSDKIFEHDIGYIRVDTMFEILDAGGFGDVLREAIKLVTDE